jgi:hypothetical protein
MARTSFPVGVVVSMEGPVARENLQPDPAVGEVVYGVDEVAQVAGKPVELPYD